MTSDVQQFDQRFKISNQSMALMIDITHKIRQSKTTANYFEMKMERTRRLAAQQATNNLFGLHTIRVNRLTMTIMMWTQLGMNHQHM